jgi:prepilin-type N-terminal cleavage/methylation domain-containing protein
MSSKRSDRGFTVVEMMFAMAIMVGVTAAIFALVDPARGTYRTQPEVSDMQQRLRVGSTFLLSDLLMAGAGSPAGGALTGSLMNYFAPIQPYRTGMINSDPDAGIFYRDDAITIFYIPPGSAQTSIETAMPTPSSELKVNPEPSCAGSGAPLSCKFTEGMRIIIFDETGAFDDMTITQVQDGANHLQHNKQVVGNELSKAYDAGAQVAQVVQRTFYYNANTQQLMYYDGDQRDEAAVDNVVDLEFEYFGETRPPVLVTGPTGAKWTTYGPKPPAIGVSSGTTWPAGENCVFMVDPVSGAQVARLPDLAPGSSSLVKLTQAQLTNGPWCPDGGFPSRFDADLLRVRKIGVMLRVQVASAELRGPAGALFRRGGTSNSARTLVPDQEIRFEITPRNFNLGR